MEDPKDNRKLSLYGREEEGPVEHEVARLPLQDQVAMVRRASCTLWRDAKVRWQRLEHGVQTEVNKTRTKAKESLSSVGVTDTALVLKATAIGSTFLLGLALTRKRTSLTGRLLWSSLGAGLMGVALYLPSPEQRRQVWSKGREMEEGYRASIVKWRTKGSEDKSSSSSSRER